MADYLIKSTTAQNIANKIREKLNNTEQITMSDVVDNIDSVYDTGHAKGKQDYQTEFWTNIQTNKTAVKSYRESFAGDRWNDTIYNPIFPINANQSLRCYHLSNITDTKVPIVLGAELITNENQIYEVHSTLSGARADNMFNSSKIVNIVEIVVNEGLSLNTTFTSCTDLVNLNIVGTIGTANFNVQASTKLNKESIVKIINCLSSTATGLSVLFSKTAINNAFNIDVDDETTYPEGSEYYILRHSKDNWTFSYK